MAFGSETACKDGRAANVGERTAVNGSPVDIQVVVEGGGGGVAEGTFREAKPLGTVHGDGGGWAAGKSWFGETGKKGDAFWVNNWDFPDDSKKDYSRCFEKKIKPQVKELLTNYGEISLIWFDTPINITKDQSMELYEKSVKYYEQCSKILDDAKQKLEIYRPETDTTEDFDVI